MHRKVGHRESSPARGPQRGCAPRPGSQLRCSLEARGRRTPQPKVILSRKPELHHLWFSRRHYVLRPWKRVPEAAGSRPLLERQVPIRADSADALTQLPSQSKRSGLRIHRRRFAGSAAKDSRHCSQTSRLAVGYRNREQRVVDAARTADVAPRLAEGRLWLPNAEWPPMLSCLAHSRHGPELAV